jgi:hypothetical protein
VTEVVNAISAQFPFPHGQGLVLYHRSPVEKYFPVAPGIEVSAGPFAGGGRAEQNQEIQVYNRRGRLISAGRKGGLIDTRL